MLNRSLRVDLLGQNEIKEAQRERQLIFSYRSEGSVMTVTHFILGGLNLRFNWWENSTAFRTLRLITHLWLLSTRTICDCDVCLL